MLKKLLNPKFAAILLLLDVIYLRSELMARYKLYQCKTSLPSITTNSNVGYGANPEGACFNEGVASATSMFEFIFFVIGLILALYILIVSVKKLVSFFKS